MKKNKSVGERKGMGEVLFSSPVSSFLTRLGGGEGEGPRARFFPDEVVSGVSISCLMSLREMDGRRDQIEQTFCRGWEVLRSLPGRRRGGKENPGLGLEGRDRLVNRKRQWCGYCEEGWDEDGNCCLVAWEVVRTPVHCSRRV